MPRVTIRLIALLAIAGGILVDVVMPGNAIGVNATLVMAVLLASSFAVAGRAAVHRMDPADAWLAPASVALAGMAAIRTDAWLVAIDLWFSLLLALAAIGALAGGRITRGVVPRVIELSVGLVAVMTGGAIVVLRELLTRRGPGPTGAPLGAPVGAPVGAHAPADVASGRLERLRPIVPVLRGLLVAVPIVAVFVVLFASADAVFARVVGDLLAWQVDVDLGVVIERTVIVSCIAWVWAGLFAFGGGLLPGLLHPVIAIESERPAPLTANPSDGAARRVRFGSVEVATVLVVLDLLFASFVALQVAYLFGGRDTMATVGLTFAEYARRGFFELVAVAVLAVAVVVTLDLGVGRRTRVQLGASLALLALTALVLVSAFVRLRLYQDAYGWTELRFVVLVAIGWLAVTLVVVTGLLATRRTAWTLHALGILLLVTLGGMNVVGPQAFVAERNLERAINPLLVPAGGRTGLDVPYLSTLGDEAVPAVVAAIDRLPLLEDRAWLAGFLAGSAADLREQPDVLGWPAWNLSRERARQALAAWEARRTDALLR